MRYLLEGKLPKQKKMEFKGKENLEIMRGISEKLSGLPKKVEWDNTYANYGASVGDEKLTYPAFTNYTAKFKDTIDHILYTKKNVGTVMNPVAHVNRLIPRRILKIPTEAEIKNKCLPNRKFPSDHLPIMALFELI